LALRIGAADIVEWYVRRSDPERLCVFDDTNIYWGLAQAICAGEPYQYVEWSDIPHFAIRTPGYPLLLAACQAVFGEQTLAVRLIQAVLGVMCVYLVYCLARQFRNPAGLLGRSQASLVRSVGSVGEVSQASSEVGTQSHSAEGSTAARGGRRHWTVPLLAAAIAAIHPYYVLMSSLILSEAVFEPLMLASLLGLAVLWPGPPPQAARGSGGSDEEGFAGAAGGRGGLGRNPTLSCLSKGRTLQKPPTGSSPSPRDQTGTGASPFEGYGEGSPSRRTYTARLIGGSKAVFVALLTGAAAGAAVLVRPSWALFVPAMLAAWMIASRRDRRERAATVRGTLICTLGVVLVMGPWWYRNWQVFNRFVPTALWLGASLYDGINPQATGASEMTPFLSDPAIWPLDEQDQDAELTRRAVAFAREHPIQVLRLAAVKFGRFWSPWPNAAGFRAPALALASAIVEIPLFGLIGLGIWNRRRDLRAWVLLAGPLLYFCTLHLVFASSMRYRIPGEMPALGLAAIGLALGASASKEPERPIAAD